MILLKKIAYPGILLLILIISGSFYPPESSIVGAWHEKMEDDEAVLICKDGYMVVTEFNQVNTQFSYCTGGTYKEKNDQFIITVDFTTRKKEIEYIGTQRVMKYSISGDKISVIKDDGTTRVLTRMDDGSGELAGVWRLVSRMNNGKTDSIGKDSRETLKIISGKRFQWVTFDPEKNEFVGGGGGNYIYKEGKYSENIECYAKNSYKVGTSVVFDAFVNNNSWTIKGKGVEEVWRKVDSR